MNPLNPSLYEQSAGAIILGGKGRRGKSRRHKERRGKSRRGGAAIILGFADSSQGDSTAAFRKSGRKSGRKSRKSSRKSRKHRKKY